MKLIFTHRHHQPSPSFIALVEERLGSLREALQIDEARVTIERRLDASPAFLVTAHLVTPGPDVIAEAVDHTLRAALGKLFGKLEARIDQRHERRARRVRSNLQQPAIHRTRPVAAESR